MIKMLITSVSGRPKLYRTPVSPIMTSSDKGQSSHTCDIILQRWCHLPRNVSTDKDDATWRGHLLRTISSHTKYGVTTWKKVLSDYGDIIQRGRWHLTNEMPTIHSEATWHRQHQQSSHMQRHCLQENTFSQMTPSDAVMLPDKNITYSFTSWHHLTHYPTKKN